MRRKGRRQSGGYVMRDKVFEILRLWEMGHNKTQISCAVKVHRQTVREYVSKAKVFGVKSCEIMELPDDKVTTH